MKKLEMIVRPEKLEELKQILNDLGIKGLTVSMVMGAGNQKGKLEIYRGTELNINLLHKVKVEVVVSDEAVEPIVSKVRETLVTGNVGDGKIFIFAVENAIRIRTGEEGDKAL
ncbi:MAG TPA: P-II family nitrogen regulator [Clostridiaceae bacterium]